MGLQSLLLVGALPLLVSARYLDARSATTVGSTTSILSTTSATPTSTTTSLPTQSGLASNCNKFHEVVSGDTCDAIEAAAGITSAEFMEWNPSIHTACDNLWLGYYVCVGVPGSGTTTSTETSSTTASLPTQSGLAANCNKFHEVVSGDTCASIETSSGITSAQFLLWNPSIDSACDNLWLGYNVCVGVLDATPTSQASTTTTAASTPSPTMPGIISSCKTYYQIASGNTCDTVESMYSITLAQILEWNTDVDSSCDNLWLGYYICVGV